MTLKISNRLFFNYRLYYKNNSQTKEKISKQNVRFFKSSLLNRIASDRIQVLKTDVNFDFIRIRLGYILDFFIFIVVIFLSSPPANINM
jgi:hypothetical protein